MPNFLGQNRSWRALAECGCESRQCVGGFADFHGSPLWTDGADGEPQD